MHHLSHTRKLCISCCVAKTSQCLYRLQCLRLVLTHVCLSIEFRIHDSFQIFHLLFHFDFLIEFRESYEFESTCISSSTEIDELIFERCEFHFVLQCS